MTCTSSNTSSRGASCWGPAASPPRTHRERRGYRKRRARPALPRPPHFHDERTAVALNVEAYFARHLQTLVGSLGRLARQPFASFLTIAVIAIALALALSLDLVLQNALNATSTWRNAFEISVYLDKSPSPARSEAIAKQLQQRSDVAAVRVVTAAQALAEFREYSGFGQALDALNDNPLPDTLVVTPSISASTPEGTNALKIAIAAIP